jgi:catechol 2,3-dioxygenase-like lactoylglutathione lyase family enzyme
MAMISGDGVFSHACIRSGDLAGSVAFYDAVLASLGVRNLGPFGDSGMLYGKDKTALVILRVAHDAVSSDNSIVIGFAAKTAGDVDAFHAAGLEAGGTDEGAAGPRDHFPGAYAAYLRDPTGNKICAYTFIAS